MVEIKEALDEERQGAKINLCCKRVKAKQDEDAQNNEKKS